MSQEEVTELVLKTLRRPRGASLAIVTLHNGDRMAVKIEGIECFGEIRSLEVVRRDTGEKCLISYEDIENLEIGQLA